MSEADTFDLLLFRTNAFIAKGIRAVSKSHFDHVGILLKNTNDPRNIYMMDATMNGVCTYSWHQLRLTIGSDKHYEKVVFKKVNFDRNDKVVDKLEEFMHDHMGDSYSASASKLLRRKTMGMQ